MITVFEILYNETAKIFQSVYAMLLLNMKNYTRKLEVDGTTFIRWTKLCDLEKINLRFYVDICVE